MQLRVHMAPNPHEGMLQSGTIIIINLHVSSRHRQLTSDRIPRRHIIITCITTTQIIYLFASLSCMSHQMASLSARKPF